MWPEATTTVMPLALQLAINGYAMNLDSWNELPVEAQDKLQASIDRLVDDIWAYSEELYDDAMRCNTGQEPCTHGVAYDLEQVPVTEADLDTVKTALTETSLPIWAKQCNAVNPTCEEDWLATIGVSLGL